MSVNTIFKKAMLSTAVFFTSAFSANVFAVNVFTTKAASSLNCVTINNDLVQIEKFKQAGTYRFAKGGVQRINFDFASEQPFKNYLVAARAHINAQNPKANMPCPIKTETSKRLYADKPLQVVDLITPFELKAVNEKAAVLLIHGLTDSPYLFHDLANSFVEQGISVRTLLLPGHGTAAEALVDIDQADWRQAASYAIKSMLNDFDNVYLGGFSTGGALVVDYLNHNALNETEQQKLKGIMLWSPASEAKAGMAWAAKYVSWFQDYLDEAADIDFAKYESFPANAGAQVHALMKRIEPQKLKGLRNIPFFVVASEVDQTIETDVTVNMLAHWHGQNGAAQAQDKLVYYYANNVEDQLNALPNSLKTVTTFSCEGQVYCKRVLDIAHTSPTNAPSNPHYGWQGSYRNCEHLTGTDLFASCKTANAVTLGELTEANLETTPNLQRLTFNPYYDQMLEQMQGFIKSTLR
ncbi:alpha/beta hydrolase [Pseudoalteromonas phenolica]|uniref:alpha/beta hydrolase n=1 Tax=Pseudoalteromonas phenolica TaxID=161398 RepID=UPI00110A6E74|nr:alpha/beta fold hydrolase [Pseudoalteromonas phenolica]TMO58030.1 lysophospholipase [Pseudoalteromonas phenolica]